MWSDLAGSPRPKAVDAICLGMLAFYGAFELAMIPLIPSLIGTWPVLLEALQGGTPALVAAGAFARIGRVELWLAVAAGVFGLACFDPVIWWAGRRYGRRLADFYARRSPRQARALDRAERAFKRWGAWAVVFAYYIPVPNNLIYAAAGETGMPLWRFLALDLVGTVGHVLLVVGLGYAIGQGAVDLATGVSRNAFVSTVALVAVLSAASFVRQRRDAIRKGPVAIDPPGGPPRRG